MAQQIDRNGAQAGDKNLNGVLNNILLNQRQSDRAKTSRSTAVQTKRGSTYTKAG